MSILLTPPQAIEVVDPERCAVGESPRWDHRDGSLYWIDVRGPTIHRISADGSRSQWTLQAEIGSIALARFAHGVPVLLVAGHGGYGRFDPISGALHPMMNPETDRPSNRLNDGKVDQCGRFWAGSLEARSPAPVGRLWRLDADQTAHQLLDQLAIPNGIVWSPDHRYMYFSESLTGRIDRCDFDLDTGTLGKRSVFAAVAPGRGLADGAAIDTDGALWSAYNASDIKGRFEWHQG